MGYSISMGELVWIFDKSDQVKKLFKKYNFCPLPRMKMKLKTTHKLGLNITFTATEFFMKIQTRDDIGDDYNEEFSVKEAMI